MKKWEYEEMIVEAPCKICIVASTFGKQGWELATSIPLAHSHVVLIFKREIPEPPAEMSNSQRASTIYNQKCVCGHEYWKHINLGGACDSIGCECQKFQEPPAEQHRTPDLLDSHARRVGP